MKLFRPLAVAVLILLTSFSSFAQSKATKQLSLVVNPGSVAITTTTIPNGMVGLSYAATVNVTGGLTPYAFTVSTGALPAGLTITPVSGAIGGTPTATGTFTFTIQVADAETPAVIATQSYTMTVYQALVVTTTTLPSANIGTAYSSSLAATGGLAPYTWAVTTGFLPAGLTMSTAGVISGTPTAAGTFNFTVTVTDSSVNVAKLRINVRIATGK